MKRAFYKTGFTPASSVQRPGLLKFTAAAVTIVKGDAIFDDGNGYATNATTALGPTFLGIAANGCSSGGDVYVIPASENVLYWAKNAGGSAAAQTDIGELIDLQANNTVDVTDVTLTANGWGFKVIEIDISADALLASSNLGFVKGYFEKVQA